MQVTCKLSHMQTIIMRLGEGVEFSNACFVKCFTNPEGKQLHLLPIISYDKNHSNI